MDLPTWATALTSTELVDRLKGDVDVDVLETVQKMGIRCADCDVVVGGGLLAFKRHLKDTDTPHNPPFTCISGDCHRRKFRVKSSFIRHLQDYHGIEENSDSATDSSSDNDHHSESSSPSSSSSSSSTSTAESSTSDSDYSVGGAPPGDDNGDNADHENDNGVENEEDFNKNLEKEAALLVLNLRRRGNVTGVAITAFGEESQRLIDAIVLNTQKLIAKNLRNAGVDELIIENCVGNVPHCEPFKKLLRKDQQIKYFENNFGLVKAVPKFLGYREDTTTNEAGNTIPAFIKTVFHYVSVKKLLVSVLNNPVLLKLIHSEKKSTDGKLRSFLDGTRARDNALVVEFPHTIRITLHGDDFDPSNALGSKTGFHKTTEINMQIQNLPPEENARLRSVFVLVYANRQDLPKERGIDPLLEPILAEMEELETREGAVVSVNGRPYVLRATIVTVAADDLEAHEVCGLLSPSANRFCTHCLVSRPNMHKDIFAMGELRSKELHSFHIQELQTKSKKFTDSSYGLERNALLVRAVKNAILPEAAIKDGMHDILRGVGPMEIKLALHEFCCKLKLFDVQSLNNAVHKFKYGPADSKNKPSPNFSEDSIFNKGSYGLHQTAAQTWCLLRCFPFLMVSLKVPANNPHLKCVVLLKRISDIIFSTIVSDDDLLLLEELLHEHHALFFQLYPPPAVAAQPTEEEEEEEEEEERQEDNGNEDFLFGQEEQEVDDPNSQATTSSSQPVKKKKKKPKKPKVIRPINKHHHLLHYPDLIRKYGPAVLYWCMRFEGKHAGAVRFAKIVNNYKCLTKTFSDWQQFNQCAEMLEWRTSVKQEISLSTGKVISVASSPYCDALKECGLEANSVIQVSKTVKIGGFVFEKGLCVHLPLTLHNLPSFGMIRSVCVHEDNLYIITEDCCVVEYDENFGAYLLDLSNETSVIRAYLWNDLPQDQPIPLMTADNHSYYLSPRRTLVENLLVPENE